MFTAALFVIAHNRMHAHSVVSTLCDPMVGGNSLEVHQQANKQIVVHPHNVIIFINKKKRTDDTFITWNEC